MNEMDGKINNEMEAETILGLIGVIRIHRAEHVSL